MLSIIYAFFLYVSYFLHPSMLSPVRVWRCVYARKHTHTEIQMAPVIESISYSISSFSILNLWCGKRWKWIGLVGTTSQHSHLISYIYIYVDDISICSRRKALTLSIYLCASSLCCCRSCFHSRTLTLTHMHGDYLHAHRWYVNPLSFRHQAHLVSSRMALERTYFATQLSNVGIVYGIEFDTRYLQYTHTHSALPYAIMYVFAVCVKG